MNSYSHAKVLLVDDELPWRRMILRLLDGVLEEKNVMQAETFDAALGLINRHFFHAAFLDVSLDKRRNDQGMDLLRTLNEQSESTGVIIFTSYGTVMSTREALRHLNAVDFLDKTELLPEDLHASLQAAVSRADNFLATNRQDSSDVRYLFKNAELHSHIANQGHDLRTHVADVIKLIVPKLAPLRIAERYEQFEVGESGFLVSTRCWSRYQGKAVGIELGSRRAIEARMNAIYIDNDTIRRSTRQNISGIVYELPDLTPEDFDT